MECAIEEHQEADLVVLVLVEIEQVCVLENEPAFAKEDLGVFVAKVELAQKARVGVLARSLVQRFF